MGRRRPSGLFTIAHAAKWPTTKTVSVYRAWHTMTLAAALRRARKISLAGYLVWIEQTGRLATR